MSSSYSLPPIQAINQTEACHARYAGAVLHLLAEKTTTEREEGDARRETSIQKPFMSDLVQILQRWTGSTRPFNVCSTDDI